MGFDSIFKLLKLSDSLMKRLRRFKILNKKSVVVEIL